MTARQRYAAALCALGVTLVGLVAVAVAVGAL